MYLCIYHVLLSSAENPVADVEIDEPGDAVD